MKQIRTIINGVIWTIVAIYLVFIVMLHIPAVRQTIGNEVADVLSDKLGTKVEIGSVDLGFLNRAIVDDVLIYDQQNKKMLTASRISAKVDIIPLFKGHIAISSVQLFGVKGDLYRPIGKQDTNFQFAIDSIASKDTTRQTPLDLRINSLVIRNGALRWNDFTKKKSKNFDSNHLDVSNISAHLLLHHLTDSTLSLDVKRLALNEVSGLRVKSLSFAVEADANATIIENFKLELPSSDISLPLIRASYQTKNGRITPNSVKYNVKMAKSTISPADFSFIDPSLRKIAERMELAAVVDGTTDDINVKSLHIESSDHHISIHGDGSVRYLSGTPQWRIHAAPLKINDTGIEHLSHTLKIFHKNIPDVVDRIGGITYRGEAGGRGDKIFAKGSMKTGVGDAIVDMHVDGNTFDAVLETKGINIGKITGSPKLGMLAAQLKAKGFMPKDFDLAKANITAKGKVDRFFYDGYTYQNISVDGVLSNLSFDGRMAMDDPNGKIDFDGIISKNAINAKASVRHLNPRTLKLTDQLGNRTFDVDLVADMNGKDFHRLNGVIDVKNFNAVGDGDAYHIGNLHANIENGTRRNAVDISSDFGDVHAEGKYDYSTLWQSIQSVVSKRVPSLFARKTSPANNVCSFRANIVDAEMLRKIFKLPLTTHRPTLIQGQINDRMRTMSVMVDAPDVTYDGQRLKNILLTAETPDETLHVVASGDRISDSGHPFTAKIDATAANDTILFHTFADANNVKATYGNLNAKATLSRAYNGKLSTRLDILPGEVVFDTLHLAVQPSYLIYNNKTLDINHFEVSNDKQSITIDGQTSGSSNDSLFVEVNDLDVKYILDLVNFHSVKFTGIASGQGYVKSFFNNPVAYGHLDVGDFRFQDGEFGTLHADISYDNKDRRINISSIADDGSSAYTDINGYLSVKDNFLNLFINAHETRMQFLEGFTSSVTRNVTAKGDGWCRVFGDLKYINLEGDMIVNGNIGIRQTNTEYNLHNANIRLIPNEIILVSDSVYDRNGHLGIVTGALHHKALHKMTFDINVDARNLLCFDRTEYGDDTFKGVVYGTGKCDIIGRDGETTINADITPNKGSYIEYNAGYTGSLDDNSFIHWKDVTPTDSDSIRYQLAAQPIPNNENRVDEPDIPSDLHLNILGNITPDFTLRILMDQSTGDYMDFHGSGVLRSTFFNKGAFQIFGNYLIDNGNYTMTIQNLVKKSFLFQPESSITFSGNPFDARLNLKAIYTVNGVSLADLQLGRSFTSNNIRVNCLMNISGTPQTPGVTFDLDIPTLSSDAQQMVRSVINSEEDMNQQVLYLLAIGRFYNPGSNNADIENNAAQSQTSLAMQSILSSTLSQQLNNVLSTVIHNTNWNFGANISTGNEGWNNAEYEGLLSGHMLNNRLIFNGQFGYRDNVATNNSSFIGDFDLRYLLFPNGNLAVRVYNQTNDRYFTRNSLTTQGIGLIMKKDFNNWRDLFGRKRKKEKKSDKKH